MRTNAPSGLDLRGRFPHGAAIPPDQSSDWRIIQCMLVLVRLGIAIASHNNDMISVESTINLGGYHGTYAYLGLLIRRVLWDCGSDFGD